MKSDEGKVVDTVQEENIDFYNRLYKSSHPFLFRLHGAISFDQKSKTRLNRRMLDPTIRRALAGQPPVRVLDYGCGFGTFLLGLPRNGIEAFAYDISGRATEQLRKAARYTGRRVRVAEVDGDGRITPEGFDVILCSHVLEHVPSDIALVAEFQRVLRPGGSLLINVPVNEIWSDPRHLRSYDSERLEKLLSAAGLEVRETLESDRWSGFLLRRETAGTTSTLDRLILRSLRATLAILPWQVVDIFEGALLENLNPQQLLMLAVK